MAEKDGWMATYFLNTRNFGEIGRNANELDDGQDGERQKSPNTACTARLLLGETLTKCLCYEQLFGSTAFVMPGRLTF